MNSIIIIIIIITALTANAQGSTLCTLAEGNTTQCYGALGSPLLIHLTSTNEEDFRLTRGRQGSDITLMNQVSKSSERGKLHEECENRCKYLPNGTLRLDFSMKKDSGNYQLDTYNSRGHFLRTALMQLQIQAPVSEPDVSQVCVSAEEKKVSCSSTGDDLEFIWQLIMTTGQSPFTWRLDNQSLSRATPEYTNLSSLSLPGQLVGNLTCVVQNKVSISQTVIQLTVCGGQLSSVTPDSSFKPDGVTVIIAVIAAATALNLSLCVCTFILRKTSSSHTVNTGNSEGDSRPIVYADVTVNTGHSATRPPPTNDQALYGTTWVSSSF